MVFLPYPPMETTLRQGKHLNIILFFKITFTTAKIHFTSTRFASYLRSSPYHQATAFFHGRGAFGKGFLCFRGKPGSAKFASSISLQVRSFYHRFSYKGKRIFKTKPDR